MIASQYEHLDVVECLIEEPLARTEGACGEDVNIQDSTGKTVLMHSYESEYLNIVKTLTKVL